MYCRGTMRRGPLVILIAVVVGVALALAATGCGQPPATSTPGKVGQTQVDPIAEFRRVMETQQGWKSLDSDPGNFVARSSYDLLDKESSGFVGLIEYREEAAARNAQDQRSMESSAAPGFEETDSGSVRSWSSLYPSDTQGGRPPGTGSLEVQFSKYRFESYGDRSKIDALVGKLGYLDPSRKRTDPIAEFQAAVKESQIATSTDSGYSERSAFEDGDLVAECKLFFTPEDAQADREALVTYLESEKQEFKVSSNGAVENLWFIVPPRPEWKRTEQYAARAYNGKMMTAVSGPVEDRSKMEAVLKDLGY